MSSFDAISGINFPQDSWNHDLENLQLTPCLLLLGKSILQVEITLQIHDKNWFFLSQFYTKVKNEFSFIYYESPSFVLCYKWKGNDDMPDLSVDRKLFSDKNNCQQKIIEHVQLMTRRPGVQD